MRSASALQLRGLGKTYGERVAVADVTLDVPTGSFFGLVGPNGAGKTTTLSMATGLLRPDMGSVHIFEADIWTNPAQAHRHLGVLPDGWGLPDPLTATEALTHLGLLRGLPADTVAQRTQDLLDLLDLPPDASGRRHQSDQRVIGEYSTGMRKKMALAIALIHAPELLVLDEPLEAVDPVSAATIKALLTDFVSTGGTVILSSHVMPMVEQLCDHVAIMHEGSVRAVGPLDDLRQGISLEDVFVRLVDADAAVARRLSWLSRTANSAPLS